MRVAFLSHQWPGARMGGIGSYVRNAATALAQAGHDVHVFTFDLPADARANVPAGVTVHETPDLATRVSTGELSAPLAAALQAGGDGLYRLAIAQMLTAAFRAEHGRGAFDVVEVPEVEALGLPLLLDPAGAVPVITHLHCATAIAYAGNGVTIGPDERLIAGLEFAAIHLSDAVCAPTRRVVALTERHACATVPASIVPHTLVTDDRPFAAPPANGPVVFVGRLERLKGCELLSEALTRFLADNPAATFRFVAPDTNTAPGGRSMRRHIESVLGPGLSPRVTFLGEASRATVDAELAAASFCVMPSLWENFSMALCEAMAAGRATVVMGGTGSVEVVADAALVAERGSAGDLARVMTGLWRDGRERMKHSRRAYDRVRELCAPARVTAQRIDLYHRAIDRFRASGPSDRATRLATLAPSCAAVVLPALASLAGALCAAGTSPCDSPGARLLKVFTTLARAANAPATVLLYGAGKHTTRLLSERHAWERHGHAVVGIIDDHPRFATTSAFLGLPVRSLRSTIDAARAGEQVPAVVLSTDTYEDQFWLQTAPLRELGVTVHPLYRREVDQWISESAGQRITRSVDQLVARPPPLLIH